MFIYGQYTDVDISDLSVFTADNSHYMYTHEMNTVLSNLFYYYLFEDKKILSDFWSTRNSKENTTRDCYTVSQHQGPDSSLAAGELFLIMS